MNDRIGIEKQSQPGPVARKEATGVFEQIEGNIIANMARNSARVPGSTHSRACCAWGGVSCGATSRNKPATLNTIHSTSQGNKYVYDQSHSA